MSVTLSLTEDQMFAALRTFLLSLLPAGVEVVRGQDNRVPEPVGSDYVVMTPLFRKRLATNIIQRADSLFIGSIAAAVLTITDVTFGAIGVGSPVFGDGVASGTFVTALGTGTGGVGTYTLNNPQVIASEAIAAGFVSSVQPVEVTTQLDVMGPSSSNNAQIISTLFRDPYGIDMFSASGVDVVPLYTDDPHQMPFTDGEQQIENRWIVTAAVQCNPSVSVSQQFAGSLTVDLINVDAVYPPA